MRPPFETFTKPTCRGCYALRTACQKCEKCEWELKQLMGKEDAPAVNPAAAEIPEYGDVHEIAHDGFQGTVIGHYITREGKRGVVLQQLDTRVVHVYGRKWLEQAE